MTDTMFTLLFATVAALVALGLGLELGLRQGMKIGRNDADIEWASRWTEREHKLVTQMDEIKAKSAEAGHYLRSLERAIVARGRPSPPFGHVPGVTPSAKVTQTIDRPVQGGEVRWP